MLISRPTKAQDMNFRLLISIVTRCNVCITALTLMLVNAVQASQPIVIGYDRIYAEKPESVEGGRILFGDLSCASCHAASENQKMQLNEKRAPHLDQVGSRIKLNWIRDFLIDPQKTKPGSTMPALFAGLSVEQRNKNVEALVHFLATTGSANDSVTNLAAAKRGDDLFHKTGCIACHAPRKARSTEIKLAVPLPDVGKKYTINSLAEFLRNPHKTRPSGRMPSLNLDKKQAADLASYFLKDIKVAPNLKYKYYEGSWQSLPDFAALKPKSAGTVPGFDLGVRDRNDNFAVRYEGFLHIEQAGNYTFHLGSDDGSQLLINGKQVVIVDGIHPYSQQAGRLELKAGVHKVVVEFFEGGGEEVLTAEFEGPDVSRRDLSAAVTINGKRVEEKKKTGFQINPQLVAQGRKLFETVGCANCHQLKIDNQLVKSTTKPPRLTDLKVTDGCLSASVKSGLPNYSLSEPQRASLKLAVSELKSDKKRQTSAADTIHQTLTTFNCFACHTRNKQGGVLADRNALFQTTIKEMGDEGRIPPLLDGVGDKLTENWLKEVMDRGANDRPYMLTAMPNFGRNNVGHLVAAFRKADLRTEAKPGKIDAPPYRIKSDGRFLVGDKALSCIKCHNFDKYKATGIQSLDLTTLTKRIREDWFYRYMLNPIEYRPGTRMPTAWPFGQSTVKDVLNGNPQQQLKAIWTYLKEGTKAPVPTGLVRQSIELVAESEPIIYRNFIEGLGPRGIGVGYPEKANLAFDAETMNVAILWHGPFIDASRHWNGRGQGYQPPLGDHVLPLPKGVPFANLESGDTPWPAQLGKELGYKFQGYKFDAARRPVFRYRTGSIEIEDTLLPIPGDKEPSFKRTINLKTNSSKSENTLWYRAAVGNSIEETGNGTFRIDGSVTIKLQTSSTNSKPLIRKNNNRTELLLEVKFISGKAQIIQAYNW